MGGRHAPFACAAMLCRPLPWKILKANTLEQVYGLTFDSQLDKEY